MELICFICERPICYWHEIDFIKDKNNDLREVHRDCLLRIRGCSVVKCSNCARIKSEEENKTKQIIKSILKRSIIQNDKDENTVYFHISIIEGWYVCITKIDNNEFVYYCKKPKCEPKPRVGDTDMLLSYIEKVIKKYASQALKEMNMIL